jgi:hypothetical protein
MKPDAQAAMATTDAALRKARWLGFAKPDSFPDFTRCDQTSAEYDVDYKATIREADWRADFRPSCRLSPIR